MGEEKSIATDRVVLIAGPEEERDVVRRIFRMYATKRLSPAAIAKKLNAEGVLWDDGQPWTRYVIRDMVSNPKYLGHNVSNRRSGKLHTLRAWNPPEMWIRKDCAFEAIVAPSIFAKAEAVSVARAQHYDKAQLLDFLRDFLKKHGHITARQIAADRMMPCTQSFNAAFGGLAEAYRLIGYKSVKNLAFIERDRGLTPVRRQFSATVIKKLVEMGFEVVQNARSKLLTLNGGLTVRLSVSRCRSFGQSHGWLLRTHSANPPDVTVFARMEPGNQNIKDFFCVPKHAIGQLTQEVLRERAESQFERYKSADFSFLQLIAQRAPLKSA
jgi:Recombinase